MVNKLNLVGVKHIWSILCSSVSVDQMTNNITLFNVLEQLNVNKTEIDSQKKPESGIINIVFPHNLVVLLRKIGNNDFIGRLKVEIIDPESKVLTTNENEIKFVPGKDRLRIVISLPGIPITIPGHYSFAVSIKSKSGQYEKISEVPLEVKFN